MSNREQVIQNKQNIVDETSQKLKDSVSTIIVNYRGLTVAEVNDLRKQLRESDVELHVIKNTMLRRAAADAGIDESVNETFVGPTAVAFSFEDVSAPAKILRDFAKDHEALVLKGGIVEGNVVGVEQIDAIAELPSKEDLYAMLASAVQGPIRKAAGAFGALAKNPLRDTMLTIKALQEKKEEEAA